MVVFIGYTGLQNTYFSYVIVTESTEKYILQCILNLLNFMTQRNGKVSVKTFCGKWEGETLTKILHF